MPSRTNAMGWLMPRPYRRPFLACALLGISGCTTVTVDMRARGAAGQSQTTIVYSGARGDDARFPDYGAIDGSILRD